MLKNSEISDESVKRQQRADVARCLLQMMEKGFFDKAVSGRTMLDRTLSDRTMLGKTMLVSFDELDRLPLWLGWGVADRTQCQLHCGAVVAEKAIRLCLDQRLILACHELLGVDVVDLLVSHDDTEANYAAKETESHTQLLVDAFNSLCLNVTDGADVRAAVQTILMSAGEALLRTSVSDVLPPKMIDTLMATTQDESHHVFEIDLRVVDANAIIRRARSITIHSCEDREQDTNDTENNHSRLDTGSGIEYQQDVGGGLYGGRGVTT